MVHIAHASISFTALTFAAHTHGFYAEKAVSSNNGSLGHAVGNDVDCTAQYIIPYLPHYYLLVVQHEMAITFHAA